jgi:hypothetical protein
VAYLTKYGTLWGAIPQTAGRIFWVAPGAGGYTVDGRTYTASNDNDGLSPEQAFATLDRGVNLATANGDVVVALPGSHSPTASLAMDSAGVTLMGLPGGAGNFLRQKTTIAAVTGDQNINVTAADVEIAYLNIVPVTADTAIDLTSAADRFHCHHCSFDMATPAASTGTKAIENLETTAGPDNVLIEYCCFDSDGAQGNAITTGAFINSVIEHCYVLLSAAGTWASAIAVGAASAQVIVNDVTFHTSGGTMTDCVTGTNGVTGGVLLLRCNFPVTCDEVDGFTGGDAELNQCFIATVGGGSGGTQVTPTT